MQVQHTASQQAKTDTARRTTQAAADVAQLFSRWHDELLVASTNSALTDWYLHPERRATLRPQVSAELVALHTVYPTLVDEACFIDAGGQELARQVKGLVWAATPSIILAIPATRRRLSPSVASTRSTSSAWPTMPRVSSSVVVTRWSIVSVVPR